MNSEIHQDAKSNKGAGHMEYRGYTVRVWRNQANGRFDYIVESDHGTWSSGNYDTRADAQEYACHSIDGRLLKAQEEAL